MPALTLFALLLGGAVIAAAETGDNETPQSSSAILGASRRKIHTASTQTTT